MNRGRLLFGLLFIALGILFLLDQVGFASAGVILSAWWPAIIVALGVALLATAASRLLGILVTFTGVWLLAGTLAIIPALTPAMLWPALIVIVGLFLLFGLQRPAQSRLLEGEALDRTVLFSGIELTPPAQLLRRASLTALFGGINLDLHQVQLPSEGGRVEAVALFGGITLLVPDGWRIVMSGLPIFGGYTDKTSHSTLPAADAPTLYVDGLALFGGVEVRTYEPKAAGLPFAA